jgi:hypothetical protein
MENSNNNKPRYTAWEAVLIGHLVVNIPVLIIICGFMAWWVFIYPELKWYIFFLPGFIFGWIWWSILVPQWRRWALSKGIDKSELQRLAVMTGLVWKNGVIFEKTEFDINNDDRS